jgi:hypothetical protein
MRGLALQGLAGILVLAGAALAGAQDPGPYQCDCVCLRGGRTRVVERYAGPTGYGYGGERFAVRRVFDRGGQPVFIIEETSVSPYALPGGYAGPCATGGYPLATYGTPQGYYLPPAGVSESFGTWTGPPVGLSGTVQLGGGCPNGQCPRR